MKTFVWESAARADLRRLDKETALRILHALTRYGATGEGDVKTLTDRDGCVGKWRIFFDLEEPNTVRLYGIDNRGQAY